MKCCYFTVLFFFLFLTNHRVKSSNHSQQFLENHRIGEGFMQRPLRSTYFFAGESDRLLDHELKNAVPVLDTMKTSHRPIRSILTDTCSRTSPGNVNRSTIYGTDWNFGQDSVVVRGFDGHNRVIVINAARQENLSVSTAFTALEFTKTAMLNVDERHKLVYVDPVTTLEMKLKLSVENARAVAGHLIMPQLSTVSSAASNFHVPRASEVDLKEFINNPLEDRPLSRHELPSAIINHGSSSRNSDGGGGGGGGFPVDFISGNGMNALGGSSASAQFHADGPRIIDFSWDVGAIFRLDDSQTSLVDDVTITESASLKSNLGVSGEIGGVHSATNSESNQPDGTPSSPIEADNVDSLVKPAGKVRRARHINSQQFSTDEFIQDDGETHQQCFDMEEYKESSRIFEVDRLNGGQTSVVSVADDPKSTCNLFEYLCTLLRRLPFRFDDFTLHVRASFRLACRVHSDHGISSSSAKIAVFLGCLCQKNYAVLVEVPGADRVTVSRLPSAVAGEVKSCHAFFHGNRNGLILVLDVAEPADGHRVLVWRSALDRLTNIDGRFQDIVVHGSRMLMAVATMTSRPQKSEVSIWLWSSGDDSFYRIQRLEQPYARVRATFVQPSSLQLAVSSAASRDVSLVTLYDFVGSESRFSKVTSTIEHVDSATMVAGHLRKDVVLSFLTWRGFLVTIVYEPDQRRWSAVSREVFVSGSALELFFLSIGKDLLTAVVYPQSVAFFSYKGLVELGRMPIASVQGMLVMTDGDHDYLFVQTRGGDVCAFGTTLIYRRQNIDALDRCLCKRGNDDMPHKLPVSEDEVPCKGRSYETGSDGGDDVSVEFQTEASRAVSRPRPDESIGHPAPRCGSEDVTVDALLVTEDEIVGASTSRDFVEEKVVNIELETVMTTDGMLDEQDGLALASTETTMDVALHEKEDSHMSTLSDFEFLISPEEKSLMTTSADVAEDDEVVGEMVSTPLIADIQFGIRERDHDKVRDDGQESSTVIDDVSIEGHEEFAEASTVYAEVSHFGREFIDASTTESSEGGETEDSIYHSTTISDKYVKDEIMEMFTTPDDEYEKPERLRISLSTIHDFEDDRQRHDAFDSSTDAEEIFVDAKRIEVSDASTPTYFEARDEILVETHSASPEMTTVDDYDGDERPRELHLADDSTTSMALKEVDLDLSLDDVSTVDTFEEERTRFSVEGSTVDDIDVESGDDGFVESTTSAAAVILSVSRDDDDDDDVAHLSTVHYSDDVQYGHGEFTWPSTIRVEIDGRDLQLKVESSTAIDLPVTEDDFLVVKESSTIIANFEDDDEETSYQTTVELEMKDVDIEFGSTMKAVARDGVQHLYGWSTDATIDEKEMEVVDDHLSTAKSYDSLEETIVDTLTATTTTRTITDPSPEADIVQSTVDDSVFVDRQEFKLKLASTPDDVLDEDGRLLSMPLDSSTVMSVYYEQESKEALLGSTGASELPEVIEMRLEASTPIAMVDVRLDAVIETSTMSIVEGDDDVLDSAATVADDQLNCDDDDEDFVKEGKGDHKDDEDFFIVVGEASKGQVPRPLDHVRHPDVLTVTTTTTDRIVLSSTSSGKITTPHEMKSNQSKDVPDEISVPGERQSLDCRYDDSSESGTSHPDVEDKGDQEEVHHVTAGQDCGRSQTDITMTTMPSVAVESDYDDFSTNDGRTTDREDILVADEDSEWKSTTVVLSTTDSYDDYDCIFDCKQRRP